MSSCQMHLLATRHPCLDNPGFTTFLILRFEIGGTWFVPPAEERNRFGLFLLAPLITAAKLNLPDAAILPPQAPLSFKMATNWMDDLDLYTLRNNDRELFIGLELISTLTWAVNRLRKLQSGASSDRLKPPSFAELFLPSFMEQNAYFNGESLSFDPNLFPSSVSAMAIPESEMMSYLTSGSWTGYYSYSLPSPNRLDPPMRDIRFHAAGEFTLRSADHYRLEAGSAIDGIGPFGLRGNVNPKTGRLTMIKRYKMPGGPHLAVVRYGDTVWYCCALGVAATVFSMAWMAMDMEG